MSNWKPAARSEAGEAGPSVWVARRFQGTGAFCHINFTETATAQGREPAGFTLWSKATGGAGLGLCGEHRGGASGSAGGPTVQLIVWFPITRGSAGKSQDHEVRDGNSS